jgi:hypothetical protein
MIYYRKASSAAARPLHTEPPAVWFIEPKRIQVKLLKPDFALGPHLAVGLVPKFKTHGGGEHQVLLENGLKTCLKVEDREVRAIQETMLGPCFTLLTRLERASGPTGPAAAVPSPPSAASRRWIGLGSAWFDSSLPPLSAMSAGAVRSQRLRRRVERKRPCGYASGSRHLSSASFSR